MKRLGACWLGRRSGVETRKGDTHGDNFEGTDVGRRFWTK